MDITHVLTISTAHITRQTADLLVDADSDVWAWPCCVSVYDKAEYGWWIFAAGANVRAKTMPKDLVDCIRLATRHNCDWLCLDCDGEIVPELPQYDW